MSDKQLKAVSFIGGLLFFSVVVGVILFKNDKIRAEVEEQAKSLLNITKGAVSQVQFVVSKINKITGGNNSAQADSNIDGQSIDRNIDKYDALWSSVED